MQPKSTRVKRKHKQVPFKPLGFIPSKSAAEAYFDYEHRESYLPWPCSAPAVPCVSTCETPTKRSSSWRLMWTVTKPYNWHWLVYAASQMPPTFQISRPEGLLEARAGKKTLLKVTICLPPLLPLLPPLSAHLGYFAIIEVAQHSETCPVCHK